MKEEIQKAHVICIVYSVDDEDTLDRAASYWLPLVRKCSSSNRCPVVLVGNKIDLVDYSTIEVQTIVVINVFLRIVNKSICRLSIRS